MDVGSSAQTCTPNITYQLPAFDTDTQFHGNFTHVPIKGAVSKIVVDDYVVAITLGEIIGAFNVTIAGRINGCSLFCRKIHARMKFQGFVYGMGSPAKA